MSLYLQLWQPKEKTVCCVGQSAVTAPRGVEVSKRGELSEMNQHTNNNISLTAVMADAKAICRRLLALKQQLFIAAPAASALDGSA